jgi:hypothetical protein
MKRNLPNDKPSHAASESTKPVDETKSVIPISHNAVFGVWLDVKKELPNHGEYVLVHVTLDNWGDNPDVYFRVVRFERGISQAQRDQMKRGEIPDGDEYGAIAPNDYWQRVNSKRSDTVRGADEWGNNKRAYQWVEHGAGSFFGQEVDYWMRIPKPNPSNG